jgi:putative copper resistance protein D
MGIASGAAVALSRTPPPVDTSLPDVKTPAEILTGCPCPRADHLALDHAVGHRHPVGVRRRLRSSSTSPARGACTAAAIAGRSTARCCGCWACSPALGDERSINAYQDYLFSMHMVGHMLLSMAIPMMLVFGAPVTLASRAIAKRDDGTRGGREWILWAVHTPFARVVTHPLFAAAMFVGSLWAFYYTDLFRWTLYDHLGTSG